MAVEAADPTPVEDLILPDLPDLPELPELGGLDDDDEELAELAADPEGLVMPDQELVKHILDRMQLRYVVDTDGALLTAWPGFCIYYLFDEEVTGIYAVRAYYDKAYQEEAVPELLAALNDWNRETLWPKVYTHRDQQDGRIRLMGETQLTVGDGVGFISFASLTESSTYSSVAFDQWLTERLASEEGDPADLDEEAEDGAYDGGEDEDEQDAAAAEADGSS